ncbi:MAG: membrane dipeptidase [Acidobacteria bacterium]|nr:membrane dipeptidase [Acidobacteriota bacterium]
MKLFLHVIFPIFLVLSLMFATSFLNAENTDKPICDLAEEILSKSIVIDAHSHPLQSTYFSNPESFDLGIDSKSSQVDFIKMKASHINGVFYPMPIYFRTEEKLTLEQRISQSITLIETQVKKYNTLAAFAFSSKDIQHNFDQDLRSIMLSTENENIFRGQIDNIEKSYNLGIRQVTILNSNLDVYGIPGKEEGSVTGLSDFGKEAIREMNRLGIIIDITHTEDILQKAIIQHSEAPVIASHSNTRSVNATSRNIPDDILKMIAQKGGIICVTFDKGWISSEHLAKRAEARKKMEEERKILEEKLGKDNKEISTRIEELRSKLYGENVDIELLIDHIDHIVKTVGVDYVGLGSDFGAADYFYPEELNNFKDYTRIACSFLKRGYKEEDIRKIMGENLLRVMKEVEKISDIYKKKIKN